MYYVYLLKMKPKGGKEYYIGYSSDLRKRVLEHKRGEVRTTKDRSLELIYYEAFADKYLALRREKAIKSSGSVYMALMKRLELK